MERETNVSTLPNGLRVISQVYSAGSPLATLGLILPYGSRHDTERTLGHSYFINKLALKGTKTRSQDTLVKDIEMIGGTLTTISTRESLLYSAAIHHADADKAVELLADVALRPVYTEEAIAQETDFASFLSSELIHSPEQFLSELSHTAAFGSTGLGQRQLFTPSSSSSITPSRLAATHAQHFHPSRMVLAAVGIPHDKLMRLAGLHFGHIPAGPPHPLLAPAQYVGQDLRVALKESSSRNPYRVPLTQLSLNFPGMAWGNKDIFAISLLQCLLGGGQSFSSGGPGKGMYSRLYTHVLNYNPNVYCANALHIAYADTGLFTIHCSAEPNNIAETATLVMSELYATLFHCKQEELDRARNMLKGMILMNMESKAIACEDMCRQTLMSGRWVDPESFCNSIDNVTMQDVRQVLFGMLQRRVAIAAYGDLSGLPATLADTLYNEGAPILRSMRAQFF